MAKKSAITFGVIFLVAGVWGLVSGSFAFIFAADMVSSLIHIIAGIALLVVASKPSAAITLKTAGIIYGIFGILGFVYGSSVAGLFTTNGATNWLYLVLGIVIAALGWSSKEAVGMPSGMPQA